MSKFRDGVITVVGRVPYGKVVSYGQVALYLGMPRAARQVGWVLNQLEESISLPWWRVVNNQGRISIKGSKYTPEDQRNLLMAEGIEIAEDFTFDIEKYRFVPTADFIRKLKLDPVYLEMVAGKVPYAKIYFGGEGVR